MRDRKILCRAESLRICRGEREKWRKSDRVAQCVLLRRGWCVVESTPFVLLAFGGKRNRTFVLDTRNHMACSLFVDDLQLFERTS